VGGSGLAKGQKKVPKALKSLDAELKSAPAFRHRNAAAESSDSPKRLLDRHDQERIARLVPLE
jgi:hypothetical protein